MRIGVIGPIVESIPPEKYGGTERVIHGLVEGLVAAGHDVTLFASGDSKTSAKLISVTDKALRKIQDSKDIYGFNLLSMLNMGVAYAMQNKFDVIHDHNPHMGLPTANLSKTPVVMTWHGPFSADVSNYFAHLPKPYLVSISKSQAKLASVPGLNFLGTVYNGLQMRNYPFTNTPKDYLLFVGRIDAEKGVHYAIDAAVASGRKLIIAAKLDDKVPLIKKYFDDEIAPRLKKYSKEVEWVGEVNEIERNELMKNAYCSLHPVTWPEPFGLTLVEAMACGCPVIAFNQGSIPEIIMDGKTGYVVEDLTGMIEAIGKVDLINRSACREWALSNFSAQRMTDGYINMYKKAINLSQKYAPSAEPKFRQRLFWDFDFQGE